MAEGIVIRHKTACRSHAGGRCNCNPSFRAQVTDPDDPRRGKLRRTFTTISAAQLWRQDVKNAKARGHRPASVDEQTITISGALDELVARMRDGRWLNRSGRQYRPATIRDYHQAGRDYIKPMIGHLHISDVRRRDIQDFIDELRDAGLSASSVHNRLDVLRVTFKLAVDREWVEISPCHDLRLPAVRSRRPDVADLEQARRLLDALSAPDRALWAVLFYAGLRIGEARALRWQDVDFAADEIHVQHGWDDYAGEQEAKTEAGQRAVPLIGDLRSILAAHKLQSGRGDQDLCFGETADRPFTRSTIRARALKAWKAAELEPITPHGARHTCASYLIDAGCDDMTVQRVIGHTDVRTTKNVYGHHFDGHLDDVRSKLDAYLERGSRS